ncbi:Alpha/Beta hydrolase protein [Astrocystis sublimbata]|nr:Alpha/Beta hydrolase protein [Astrocystis sublimbata]
MSTVKASYSERVKVDPEWALVWKAFTQMPKAVINDVYDLRATSNTAQTASAAMLLITEEIEETKHTISSLDGTSINVHQFVPPAASPGTSPQRAILFAFGGGMIAGSVDNWRASIKELAQRTGTQVFAVDYRLAPEHPAPAAVEDYYSAAKWLQLHAASFDVDPARIVLYGKSAGGGIATGTVLLINDKGGLQYPPAALVVEYPMLDDRTVLPADHPIQEFLIWTSKGNDLAWEAYTGKKREDRTADNVSVYAAPARAEDSQLATFPDTYIDVGGLDLFVGENIELARRLVNAGIYVEFHLYPGVPHGFNHVRHIKVAQEAIANQTKFVNRY